MQARIRLPLLVLAATLLLGVRVSALMRGDFLYIDTAHAATEEKPAPHEDVPPGKQAEHAEEKPADAAKSVPHKSAPTKEPVIDLGKEDKTDSVVIDPADQFTPSEIDLLKDLAKRRDALDAREKALAHREALDAAAELRFEQKLAELGKLKRDIQNLLKENDSAEKARVQSLVKIYENMKPKDAARIFDTLDMPVLIEVSVAMKEAKMAPVLAEMSSDRARELTMKMAERGRLPQAPPP